MNWASGWDETAKAKGLDIPPHIRTALTSHNFAHDKDGLLMLQQDYKKRLDFYKEAEMEVRKLCVDILVPDKSVTNEGVNNIDLGGGFIAKAGIKFNYKLDTDNDKIENVLDEIAAIGNEGAFIADRIITWKASFSIAEYKKLVEEADKGNKTAKAIVDKLGTILTIEDAAPTLDIKEPKAKK